MLNELIYYLKQTHIEFDPVDFTKLSVYAFVPNWYDVQSSFIAKIHYNKILH